MPSNHILKSGTNPDHPLQMSPLPIAGIRAAELPIHRTVCNILPNSEGSSTPPSTPDKSVAPATH